MSIVAIIAAIVASYILGSLWYLWLGRSWRAAIGWIEAGTAYRPSQFELIVGLVGQGMMAIALSGILATLGSPGAVSAVKTAFFLWLGFILPSLATNVIFQRRNKTLIWQDGLHWLLILASQALVLALLT